MQLFDNNRVKFAAIIADAALDAFVLVQLMGFFLFTADGILWASAKADLASRAGFGVDFIMKKRFANPSRAFLVPKAYPEAYAGSLPAPIYGSQAV